jgi:DNA primase
VEFPDFAAQARDQLDRISFRGRHKLSNGAILPFSIFATHLFRLIDEAEVNNATDVYKMINPTFHEILDYLYGRDEGGKPRGHRLRERFPILRYHVDDEYVSQCFWHFLEMLILREMEDDFSTEMASLGDHDDAASMRLVALRAAILEATERVLARDLELAEEATAFVAALKPAFKLAA